MAVYKFKRILKTVTVVYNLKEFVNTLAIVHTYLWTIQCPLVLNLFSLPRSWLLLELEDTLPSEVTESHNILTLSTTVPCSFLVHKVCMKIYSPVTGLATESFFMTLVGEGCPFSSLI